MTRPQAVLCVLVAVFASAALRWLPDDDPTNPLGLGLPLRQLALDREMVDLRDEPGELRSRIRMGLGEDDGNIRRWKRLLAKAERLVDEHAGERGPDGGPATVQLRGFPRNDHWMLAYQLYPLRITGAWFEDGGRKDDPLDPDAVDSYTNRYVAADELDADAAAEIERRKLERRELRDQ